MLIDCTVMTENILTSQSGYFQLENMVADVISRVLPHSFFSREMFSVTLMSALLIGSQEE